jgi:hypothetical protein
MCVLEDDDARLLEEAAVDDALFLLGGLHLDYHTLTGASNDTLLLKSMLMLVFECVFGCVFQRMMRLGC